MKKLVICLILLALSLGFGFSLSLYQEYKGLGPFNQDDSVGLESMTSSKSKMQRIMDNKGLYNEKLIASLERNPELLDFVFDYPERKGSYNEKIDLLQKYNGEDFPLFIQWDKDWGYASYGNGIIGLDGCGPTCLSMVYVALTGDLTHNPQVVAKFAEDKGYLDRKGVTLWTLMSEGATELGIQSRELPLDENIMARELAQGHPIICSMAPGDFTTVGHFIVIYDYVGGNFLVKDPNSRKRSEREWGYSQISSQINNIWAFSY